MQKVFKLIIDELKKATRSELKIYGGARSNSKSILLGYQKGLEDAVFIVNQTIKEYNNGWIQCSERLPGVDDDELYPICLVTLENGDVCLGVYRYDESAWYTRMSEGETVYSTKHKVLAWMPRPEAYKEGESQCKE